MARDTGSAQEEVQSADWELRRLVQEAARNQRLTPLAAFNIGLSLGSLPHVAAHAPEEMSTLMERLRGQISARDLDPGIRVTLSATLEKLEAAWGQHRRPASGG